MKIWILAVAIMSVPVQAQHARFKGFVGIQTELSTRLAPAGTALDLYEFLPADDLENLLGTWVNYGSEHVFKNGSPNPVNMLIWYTLMSGFAQSVGESCIRPQLEFNRSFLAALNRLCAWPKPAAVTDRIMLDFWLAVMGFNAPESEFLAWRDFFLNSSYRNKPAKDAVTAMTLAIALNPHFLLDR